MRVFVSSVCTNREYHKKEGEGRTIDICYVDFTICTATLSLPGLPCELTSELSLAWAHRFISERYGEGGAYADML